MFERLQEWLRPHIEFHFDAIEVPVGSTVVLRSSQAIPSHALDSMRDAVGQWAKQKDLRVLVLDGSMSASVSPPSSQASVTGGADKR